MTFTKHIFIAFILVSIFGYSQNKDSIAIVEIQKFQEKLNHEFADRKESPLTDEDFQTFESLEFFQIDLKFRVKARFVKTENPVPFEMPTTTARKPIYQSYGTLHFEMDQVAYQLIVYQNLDLIKKEEYQNYLFIPFNDLTNGEETYGGGRYIDLEGPLSEEVVLDFNQAYNPYCAYNYKYSCPIPPIENDLKTAIKAGVKKFHE